MSHLIVLLALKNVSGLKKLQKIIILLQFAADFLSFIILKRPFWYVFLVRC